MTKLLYKGKYIELQDELEPGYKELDMLDTEKNLDDTIEITPLDLTDTLELNLEELKNTQELKLGDLNE